MKPVVKGSVALLLAALCLLLIGPVALAEETACRGKLGAVSVDNLRVPANATCILNGTYIQGTINVERNATLRASAVRVIGNIQAENAKAVNIGGYSEVGGNVQIKQGGSAKIKKVRIHGDLQVEANVGGLTASRNIISGSLQAFNNTGGLTISTNRIDGNLQCKENQPPPTGGGNIVQGNKEDQCAGL